jgi:hypothetical protein
LRKQRRWELKQRNERRRVWLLQTQQLVSLDRSTRSSGRSAMTMFGRHPQRPNPRAPPNPCSRPRLSVRLKGVCEGGGGNKWGAGRKARGKRASHALRGFFTARGGMGATKKSRGP